MALDPADTREKLFLVDRLFARIVLMVLLALTRGSDQQSSWRVVPQTRGSLFLLLDPADRSNNSHWSLNPPTCGNLLLLLDWILLDLLIPFHSFAFLPFGSEDLGAVGKHPRQREAPQPKGILGGPESMPYKNVYIARADTPWTWSLPPANHTKQVVMLEAPQPEGSGRTGVRASQVIHRVRRPSVALVK
ncbi:hypothetical protein BO86DRAFT_403410 [Aspergillus japonicus CBS 114.51]|uniref:Uncharacterized protein n=1 Tax=Aspergillus japonicus CBS 114.51 TaxID=1448312 RepID=A0A8T8WQ52_ASPJA|nr:hypothetical protein BO86DRAFT_403410 [Aspergillus japonicus CBS 114.51]RAH77780.1 hypothetical protein BO86DRAFT_403410 [Aspergillus japonicus CBS 114.51]